MVVSRLMRCPCCRLVCRFGKISHVLQLHHHTVSGSRYLVLDDSEVFGSRGHTNLINLPSSGHLLPFRLGPTAGSPLPDSPSAASRAAVGYVKVLPHGAGGFSYHCFVVRGRCWVCACRVVGGGSHSTFATTRTTHAFRSEARPSPASAFHSRLSSSPSLPRKCSRMRQGNRCRSTGWTSCPTPVAPACTSVSRTWHGHGHGTAGTCGPPVFSTRLTRTRLVCAAFASDFYHLNAKLRAAYKGSPILEVLPALPARSIKFVADHVDGTFIAQRRHGLQRYMVALAHLEIMQYNRDFLAFIGLSSPDGVLRDRTEVKVSFPAGPMGLTLKPVNRVNEPAEIVGFKPLPNGHVGPAQKSGRLNVGDILSAVDGASVLHMTYGEAISLIKSRPRPVELSFLSMAAHQGDGDEATSTARSTAAPASPTAAGAGDGVGAGAGVAAEARSSGASPARRAQPHGSGPIPLQPMKRRVSSSPPVGDDIGEMSP